jgi:hypothetical protein
VTDEGDFLAAAYKSLLEKAELLNVNGLREINATVDSARLDYLSRIAVFDATEHNNIHKSEFVDKLKDRKARLNEEIRRVQRGLQAVGLDKMTDGDEDLIDYLLEVFGKKPAVWEKVLAAKQNDTSSGFERYHQEDE